MPEKLQAEAGESTLVLNGAGIRSKFVFDLYVAGLYITNKSTDAKAIIQSDDAMALRLHIISSKITSGKMTKATREGFEKSKEGNVEAISTEIEQFLTAFSDKIVDGDVFEFVFFPNLTKVLRFQKMVFSRPSFRHWRLNKLYSGSGYQISLLKPN